MRLRLRQARINPPQRIGGIEPTDYATRKIIANTVAAGLSGGSCDVRPGAGTPERAAQRGARPADEAGVRRDRSRKALHRPPARRSRQASGSRANESSGEGSGSCARQSCARRPAKAPGSRQGRHESGSRRIPPSRRLKNQPTEKPCCPPRPVRHAPHQGARGQRAAGKSAARKSGPDGRARCGSTASCTARAE